MGGVLGTSRLLSLPLDREVGSSLRPREGGGDLWQRATPEPHTHGAQVNLPLRRRLGIVSTQSGGEKAGKPLLHHVGSVSAALPLPVFPASWLLTSALAYL